MHMYAHIIYTHVHRTLSFTYTGTSTGPLVGGVVGGVIVIMLLCVLAVSLCIMWRLLCTSTKLSPHLPMANGRETSHALDDRFPASLDHSTDVKSEPTEPADHVDYEYNVISNDKMLLV